MNFLRPASRVSSGFRSVLKRVAFARSRIDAEAAQQMKSGKYESAQALMAIGAKINRFSGQVDELAKEWLQLQEGLVGELTAAGIQLEATKAKRTGPSLLIPRIVQFLNMKREPQSFESVAEGVLEQMDGSLTQKDLQVNRNGLPLWFKALQLALTRAEGKGWIENGDRGWQITPAGRQQEPHSR